MNTPRRQSIIQLVILLAGNGCGGTPGPELGVHTSAVVGGEPELQHDAVARVLRDGQFTCTGTLIGANKESPYVLTAAHCLLNLEEQSIYPVQSIAVEFVGDQVIQAKLLIPHEQADPENYKNDIALILLERFPEAVRPATLAIQQPINNMTVTVIGYGATETSEPGESLNRANTSIERLRDNGYDLKAPADTGGATGGFCGGDSGGPTFTEWWGKETVIGVHSAIQTTVVDPPGGDSANTDLCKNRNTFDVMVQVYLANNWLYEKSNGNILVDTSSGTSNPSNSSNSTNSSGDDVRAVVCGLSGAPPSLGFIAAALLGLMAIRHRRRGSRSASS